MDNEESTGSWTRARAIAEKGELWWIGYQEGHRIGFLEARCRSMRTIVEVMRKYGKNDEDILKLLCTASPEFPADALENMIRTVPKA